jgi:hypothetical protein
MISKKKMAGIDALADNHTADALPKDAKAKIRALWTAGKPILEAVRGLLFFKPKWQNVLKDFAAMDAVYG